MANDEDAQTPSIGWVKWHVGQQIDKLERSIGAAVGEFTAEREKAERTYVDEQSALSIKLLEIERTKLESRLDGQRQAIQALTERVRGLEALLIQPAKQADVVTIRRRA